MTQMTVVLILAGVYVLLRIWSSTTTWLAMKRQAVQDEEYRNKLRQKQKELNDAKQANEDASRPYRDTEPRK